MTAKCALALAFLEGRVLNVKNCFETIGYTNIGREVPRMIEGPFGVEISRVSRTGKSRYGQPVNWTDYRLNTTEYNKPGIQAMREYCRQQMSQETAKTTKQEKYYKQIDLFLNQ